MKSMCLVNHLSRWASAGLLLSLAVSALPAKAATFGFMPAGLEPVDSYQNLYGASAFQDDIANPIDTYQSSVNEAASDDALGMYTPLEQALAAAGYNPTVIQDIVSRVLTRLSGSVSGSSSLSVFQFDQSQLSDVISDAEGSSLFAWKNNKRCRNIGEKLARNSNSVPLHKQAQCWGR